MYDMQTDTYKIDGKVYTSEQLQCIEDEKFYKQIKMIEINEKRINEIEKTKIKVALLQGLIFILVIVVFIILTGEY